MSVAPASGLTFSASVARIWRFSGKELRETLRDRRTILTLVLMPLLLYPLMTIAFRQFFLSASLQKGLTERNLNEPDFLIGTAKEGDGLILERALQEGQQLLTWTRRATGNRTTVEWKRCAYGPFDDLSAALRERKIHLGFSAHALPPDAGYKYQFELFTLEDSPGGAEALAYVQERLSAAGQSQLFTQLNKLTHEDNPLPIQTWVRTVSDPEHRDTGLLATLIPLVLILMTITGAVYPAIDLTAGERERGTLEVLMAAPLPRFALLLSKYIAVLTVALFTALLNLTMMTISLKLSGMGSLLFGEAGLTVGFLLSMLGMLLLFALFFSALVLAVTSFARSFKEAQAYLIPLMLASLTPGMLALMPGLKLKGALSITPLVNVVLLGRDLFEGQVTLGVALTVIASTLLYATAALSLAARLFGAEAVLFTDQHSWADWFRRPERARPAASGAALLFYLALLFAANFLLNNWIAQQVGVDLVTRLWLMSAASFALYGGVPILSVATGHLRGDSGLGLRRFPLLCALAAILLGLSFWPFEVLFALFLKSINLTASHEGEMAPLLRILMSGKGLAAVFTVLAVVPAIAEELFFRGYLFGTLRRIGGARGAILGSAALFSLFHLFLNDSLAWERLPATLVLGLCLGWMRERIGSVIPGMLMHLAHNGMLVSLMMIPDRWLFDGSTLSYVWPVGGGLSLFLCLAFLRWNTNPAQREASDEKQLEQFVSD